MTFRTLLTVALYGAASWAVVIGIAVLVGGKS